MEPTLVAAPAPPASLGNTVFTRRNFLWLAAGSAAAMAFYAGEISRHELDIVYCTITLPRLPDPFAGFKIVQISDFHFQEYTEATFLEAVVRRVNEAAPDLVVLTGDFVSSRPLPRHFSVRMGYHCAEILSRIHCPLRYAILGNHDFLVGAHAITDALHTHGIPVLANNSVALERDGRRLWLAGTQDALEGRPNLDRHSSRRQECRTSYPAGPRARFRRPCCRTAGRPGCSPDIPTEARFVSPFCPRFFSRKWGPDTWRGIFSCATECSSTSIEASARSTCLSASAALPKFPSSPCNQAPNRKTRGKGCGCSGCFSSNFHRIIILRV